MAQLNEFSTAPIIELDAVDSTNQEAIRRILAGEVGPLWVSARTQTAGRGRLGRTWTSDTGNLFASLICPHDFFVNQLNFLPYLVGLAIARAIETATVPRDIIQLKWPNDVLLDGKKASGVLIERPSTNASIVIGVGINLTHFPSDAIFPATYVGAYAEITAATMLQYLRDAFAKELQDLRDYGSAILLSKWRDRAWGMGQVRTIRTHAGEFDAQLDYIDEDGGLVILRDGGHQTVYAGDIF